MLVKKQAQKKYNFVRSLYHLTKNRTFTKAISNSVKYASLNIFRALIITIVYIIMAPLVSLADDTVISGDVVQHPTTVKTIVVAEMEFDAEQIRAINEASKSDDDPINNVKTTAPTPTTANLQNW